MTDLLTITPREFDTELSGIYTKLAIARRAASRHLNNLRYEVGETKYRGRWAMSIEEVYAEATAIAGEFTGRVDRTGRTISALEGFDKQERIIRDLEFEVAKYDGAFNSRGGWTRFFLVNNPGGHIHSSMDCSTCRVDTEFTWLPEVSGKDEAAAVAEHGARLCTVCFPSAPVEFTTYWDKDVQAAREGTCAGSGTTDWVEGSTRFGYAAGNGGTCSHCDEWVAATSLRKVRKHKG